MDKTYKLEVKRGKFKTMRLSVKDDGTLYVVAPTNVKEREIEDFVARHTRWIRSRLAELDRIPHFTDGSRIEMMGKEYEIRTGKTRLSENFLFLPEKEREAALVRLLKRLTRTRFSALLDEISACYGFEYSGLTVTRARTRWGACNSKKHISISFRTAFLPDDVAEYLAVHELCHTRHMDHSSKFWSEVGRILPEYPALRTRLKGYLWATKCLKS